MNINNFYVRHQTITEGEDRFGRPEKVSARVADDLKEALEQIRRMERHTSLSALVNQVLTEFVQEYAVKNKETKADKQRP